MENKIKRIVVAHWGYNGGPSTVETDLNGTIEQFTRNGELWYKKVRWNIMVNMLYLSKIIN